LLAVSLLLVLATPTFGYDRAGAADYADEWATDCNPTDGICYGNDCTAFVSKAMYWGGNLPMIGIGQTPTSNNVWWNRYTPYLGWDNSQTWSVANKLYNFLNGHYGSLYGSKPGTSTSSNTGRSLSRRALHTDCRADDASSSGSGSYSWRRWA
jgi:hypothetical protein